MFQYKILFDIQISGQSLMFDNSKTQNHMWHNLWCELQWCWIRTPCSHRDYTDYSFSCRKLFLMWQNTKIIPVGTCNLLIAWMKVNEFDFLQFTMHSEIAIVMHAKTILITLSLQSTLMNKYLLDESFQVWNDDSISK